MIAALLSLASAAPPSVGRPPPPIPTLLPLEAPIRPDPIGPWWTAPEPCPPGATLQGDPAHRIGCALPDRLREGRQTRRRGLHGDQGRLHETFRAGRQHGPFQAIDQDGNVVTAGTYSENQPVGRWAWWSAEGAVRAVAEVTEGVYAWPIFHLDGTHLILRQTQAGDVAEWVRFRPGGARSEHRLHPTPGGPGYAWSWDASGQLRAEGEIDARGRGAGDRIERHPDGSVAAIGTVSGEGWEGTVWAFHPGGWLRSRTEGWRQGVHCGSTLEYDEDGAILPADPHASRPLVGDRIALGVCTQR